MVALQKRYEWLVEDANKTQGDEGVEKYGLKDEKLDDMLYHLVHDNLSPKDLRRLAATCDSLPAGYYKWTPFARDVFTEIMVSFVDAGDGDAIVETLSLRCPDCIRDWCFMERYLVEYGDKLKEPILLLGDAFRKCKDPAVRRSIATVFRRSFTGSGVSGKDDAAFVKNALSWYDKERGRLTLNPLHGRLIGYIAPHDENDPRFKCLLQFDKMPPLFVEKAAGGKR
jgi:hypothetical protein